MSETVDVLPPFRKAQPLRALATKRCVCHTKRLAARARTAELAKLATRNTPGTRPTHGQTPTRAYSSISRSAARRLQVLCLQRETCGRWWFESLLKFYRFWMFEKSFSFL